jgi:hypothetical protein
MDSFVAVSDSFQFTAPIDWSLCWSSARTAEKVGEIISRIQDFGVRVHPASRLRTYQSVLAMPVSSDRSAANRQDLALQEALQFLTVTRLLKTVDVPDLREKLKSAVGGAPFVFDDPARSKARSDQAELYVAAVLAAAGFGVEFAEPDLIVQMSDGTRVAVAVKRPRSKRKIRRNLRKATRQVVRAGLPGVVVADLSFVEGVGKPIFVRDPQAQLLLAAVLLDGYAREHETMLLEIAKRQNVVGVLLHLTSMVQSLDPPVRMASRRWLALGRDFHPALNEITKAIQRVGAPLSRSRF